MKVKLISAALLLVLLVLPLALSAEEEKSIEVDPDEIKVLILDGEFQRLPDDESNLKRLEALRGELIVGYSRYRGMIEIWEGTKSLYLINHMPLEEYTAGVVASEIGANWAEEAMKAQAVVSRTYALHTRGTNTEKKYHLTSTVLHQLYKGEKAEENVRLAVEATRGEVLVYEGEPIKAFYHSTCGGWSENPKDVFGESLPYLQSVYTDCSLSPYCMWERKIPFPEIEEALGIKGRLKSVYVKGLTSTGRVDELLLEWEPAEGAENLGGDDSGIKSRVVKGNEFRKLVGWKRVPSTRFELIVRGRMARLLGSGYGHGVGMCQWSALEMAKEGMGYREILSYFYPGAELEVYGSDPL